MALFDWLVDALAHLRHQRRCRSSLRPRNAGWSAGRFAEILEDRTLLSANVFATLDGIVGEPGGQSVVPLHLTADNFSIPNHHATLGFLLRPEEGSALDPLPVSVESAAPGRVPTILREQLANGSSLVLAKLTPGAFEVHIGGADGSTGAWELQVFLAGDVNGDFIVDTADIDILKGAKKDAPGDELLAVGDVNRDGRITGYDQARAQNNIGVSTSILLRSPNSMRLAHSGSMLTRSARKCSRSRLV